MTTRVSRLVFLASVIAFATIPVSVSGTWTDTGPSSRDTDPPVVLVHPTEAPEGQGSISIGAQIVDPSGIGSAVLWVRGEQDSEFRQVPMDTVGKDLVRAELTPWATRGASVSYYVEAHDGRGNGPAYGGNPRTPFIVRLPRQAPAAAESNAGWIPWSVGAACLLVVGLGLWFRIKESKEKREREVLDELGRLALTGAEPSAESAEAGPAEPRSEAPSSDEEREFWIGLLTPLVDLVPSAREQALKNLSARPHHHPTHGKHFYSPAKLRQKLKWVRRDLAGRGRNPAALGLPAGGKSDGSGAASQGP